MDLNSKKKAVQLGIKIGVVFLLALGLIIMVAYHVLADRFSKSLTDYSTKLIQSMVSQGVTMVENEIENELREAQHHANQLEGQGDLSAAKDTIFSEDGFKTENILRMRYTSRTKTITSDGQKENIRKREDIRKALSGKAAMYGPFFNEKKEYVVCYSAPVRETGKVVGVLSIEKDGYLFCDLIKDIRFVNSGESYIINSQGTDIAVSEPAHIEWVNSQYNGRKLLKEKEDPVTRSVVELEEKGLNGKKGIGSYSWNSGLCYLAYEPIPSQKWVLLAGVREDELAVMSQDVLKSSFSQGLALRLCFGAVLLLAALIIYWIISSMKKNAEINEKLEKIANIDPLTGLLNRRFLESDLEEKWKYPIKLSGQAAVLMMDLDNFKDYNDHYGHQMGDDCLRKTADVFKNAMRSWDSYVMRYGGEEFLAVIFSITSQAALEKAQEICRLVEAEQMDAPNGGYVTVSIGVCHTEKTLNMPLYDTIKFADSALYQAKRDGKNRAVLHEDEKK